MEQILFLRTDRAGDAIKSLPALRALRAMPLEAELHLLASHHNASLFALEEGFTLHLLPENWKRMRNEKLLSGIPNFPSRFDKAVSLLCDPSEEIDRLLSLIHSREKWSITSREGIRTFLLPKETPAGRDESQNIAHLISQAVGLDIMANLFSFSSAPQLSLQDETEAAEKMGTKRGRWLGVCPFAGDGKRSHPLKRWERFFQKLAFEEGFDKFFLFGTPSDYPRLDRLRASSGQKEKVDLCFPSTFRTLGAYLKRLDGVIAVDSGPLHLALSLGVKSLGILSGGDVERWFGRIKEGDRLLRRGIFNRYPTVFEMIRAFQKWKPLEIG